MLPIQHRDGLVTTKDRRDTDTIASPLAAPNDLATLFAGWRVESLFILPAIVFAAALFGFNGWRPWSDPKALSSAQPSSQITTNRSWSGKVVKFEVPPPRDEWKSVRDGLIRKFSKKKTAEPSQ